MTNTRSISNLSSRPHLVGAAIILISICALSYYAASHKRNPPASPGINAVALTFDDGPDPGTTPLVLDLLKRNNLKATFFVVGVFAEKHPDLIARIIEEGHEIGFHGMRHQLMTRMSRADVETDFRDFAAVMASIQPTYRVRRFRFPYGDANEELTELARQQGYEVVGWDEDTKDWMAGNTAQAIAAKIGSAPDGTIILMHDAPDVDQRLGRKAAADVSQDWQTRLDGLEKGFHALHARGLKSVTLEERSALLKS